VNEPSSMQIKIGGDLPESLLEEFGRRFQPYLEGVITPENWKGYLFENVFNNTFPEVPAGGLDGVGEFCQEHGLPYIMYTDGSRDTNSWVEFWEPEWDEWIPLRYTTRDRLVLVSQDLIQTLKQMLELPNASIQAAIKYIDEMLLGPLPKLPPFRVVKG